MRYAIRQKLNRFSPGSKHVLNVLCVSGLFLLLVVPPMRAQSNAPSVFHDEKLAVILQKISETENINFSYDAGDPVFEQRISYTSGGENVHEMLRNILLLAGLQFKNIGKQTVIFHQSESGSPQQEPTAQKKPVHEPVDVLAAPAPLAEYRLDTVFLRDTIIRIDTVRVTDTVFVEKEKPKKQASPKVKELPVDFFQPETIRDKGWAMGFFAAPALDDFSLVKGQKSFSLGSFSLGMDASKLLDRWNISFGIRLTRFNQRFTQTYSRNEGGFFATDTIDTYYTVIDFDTAWYFVTDSSWVPLEVRDYNYQRTNTLGYLGLNVSASFDLFRSQKIRVYLKAGGQLDLLIYNNGLAIFGDDPEKVTDFDNIDFNKLNIAVSAGMGLKYKLADRTDFMSELYYMRYMNKLVADFPESTQFNAIGMKLGLIFYF